MDYTFELPWSLGSLETTAHYLDTQRLKSQIATASPNDLAGSLGGPNPGPTKSKGTLDLLYTNHGFSWDWQGIFIGPMNFNNRTVAGDPDIMTVGHWWLINSTLAMKFTPQPSGAVHHRQRVQQAAAIPGPSRHGRQLRECDVAVLLRHHRPDDAAVGGLQVLLMRIRHRRLGRRRSAFPLCANTFARVVQDDRIRPQAGVV